MDRPNVYLYVFRTKSLFRRRPITIFAFCFCFCCLFLLFPFFHWVQSFCVSSTSGSLWHSFSSWIGVCLVCWSIFTVIQGTIVSPKKLWHGKWTANFLLLYVFSLSSPTDYVLLEKLHALKPVLWNLVMHFRLVWNNIALLLAFMSGWTNCYTWNALVFLLLAIIGRSRYFSGAYWLSQWFLEYQFL